MVQVLRVPRLGKEDPALGRRSGAHGFMIPELPLAPSTPGFSRWSRLPSMQRTRPLRRRTRLRQRQAHLPQVALRIGWPACAPGSAIGSCSGACAMSKCAVYSAGGDVTSRRQCA
ncbi:MAG: hypothetical protein U1E95_00960 [Rubrivivax sp.]